MQTWNKEIRVDPIASRTPSGSRRTAIEKTFVMQGFIQDASSAHCKDQRYRLESARCKGVTDQTRLPAASYFSQFKVSGVARARNTEEQKRATYASVFENNFHRRSLFLIFCSAGHFASLSTTRMAVGSLVAVFWDVTQRCCDIPKNGCKGDQEQARSCYLSSNRPQT